jgi:hypothetical protein
MLIAISMLAALFLVTCGGAAAQVDQGWFGARDSTAPAYTVAQIHSLLRYHPAAVVGRTVRVRGILEGPFVFCGESRPCPPATLGLIDDENQSVGPDQYLPLVARTAAGLRAILGRIPLLRALVPAPQRLQFGLPATYRLQLREAPALCRRNPAVLCYEGVLPDAAPSASTGLDQG